MPSRDDEPRYQMLETVREFGLERLDGGRGRTMTVRERHARHFLHARRAPRPRDTVLMDLESITRLAA